MTSRAAHKRLQKEYASLAKAPPPYIIARPDEDNLLECHFILRGPEGEVYEDGEYHGVLLFPPTYPFAPPGIKMFTPSGRFSPDKKLCTSMSDFHPGSWNPAWSIETILTGLLSFMLSDELTTGSVRGNDSERRAFAKASHAYNLKSVKFRAIFTEYSETTMKRLPNMGEKEKGCSGSQPVTNQATAPSLVPTPPDLPGSPIAIAPAGRVARIRILWWTVGTLIASALVMRFTGR